MVSLKRGNHLGLLHTLPRLDRQSRRMYRPKDSQRWNLDTPFDRPSELRALDLPSQ